MYTYVYTHIYSYTYIHTDTHIYTYRHKHLHIYEYIHTVEQTSTVLQAASASSEHKGFAQMLELCDASLKVKFVGPPHHSFQNMCLI